MHGLQCRPGPDVERIRQESGGEAQRPRSEGQKGGAKGDIPYCWRGKRGHSLLLYNKQGQRGYSLLLYNKGAKKELKRGQVRFLWPAFAFVVGLASSQPRHAGIVA